MKLLINLNNSNLIKSSGTPPRPGLVYTTKTVTRGGKTFQQGFWVSQSQAQAQAQATKANNTVTPVSTSTSSSQGATDVNTLLSTFVSSYGKDAAIAKAQKLGITWKANQHAGINWMRCSMAIKNGLNKVVMPVTL